MFAAVDVCSKFIMTGLRALPAPLHHYPLPPGSDEARAQRMVRAIKAGICWVNCSQPCFCQVRVSGLGFRVWALGCCSTAVVRCCACARVCLCVFVCICVRVGACVCTDRSRVHACVHTCGARGTLQASSGELDDTNIHQLPQTSIKKPPPYYHEESSISSRKKESSKHQKDSSILPYSQYPRQPLRTHEHLTIQTHLGRRPGEASKRAELAVTMVKSDSIPSLKSSRWWGVEVEWLIGQWGGLEEWKEEAGGR